MFGLFSSNKVEVEVGDIRMQRKLMSRGEDPEIVEVTDISEEDAEVVKYLRAMHNIHTTRHIHCTPGTQRVAFPEDNKMMHCRLHTLKVAAFSLLTMLQDLSVGTHVITHQACGGTAIRTPLWHRSIKSSHLLQFSQPHTNEYQLTH